VFITLNIFMIWRIQTGMLKNHFLTPNLLRLINLASSPELGQLSTTNAN